MALKNTADGQLLQTNVGLWSINTTGYTVACWVRLDSTAADWKCGWAWENNTNNYDALYLRTNTDYSWQCRLNSYWNSTGLSYGSSGPLLVSGTWNFIAVSRPAGASASALIYHATLANTSLTSYAHTTSSGTPTTPTTFTILDSVGWTGENAVSTMGHLKVWNAVLSQAEIQKEMFSFRPKQVGNLQLWNPLIDLDQARKDYSGNGRVMSVTGTPALDPGPTIQFIDVPAGYSRRDSSLILLPNLRGGELHIAPSAAAGPDTFNVTTTDSATTSDTISVGWTTIGSNTESVSALDTQSVAWTAIGSNTESATVSDSQSVVWTAIGTQTESVTASDAQSTTWTAVGTISETLLASDIESVTWIVPVDFTESSNATDIELVTWTTVGTLSESTSASDTHSVEHLQGVTEVTLSESISASDSNSSIWTTIGTISESVSASETQSAAWTAIGTIAESASSTDVQSVEHLIGGALDVSLAESVSASDTQSVIWTTVGTISESASTSDIQSVAMAAVGTFTESATVSDIQSVTWTAIGDISESASASDSISVATIWATALLENAIPIDSIATASIFNTLQDESISVSDSMSGIISGAVGLTPEDLAAIATAVWAHPKALTLGKFLALK